MRAVDDDDAGAGHEPEVEGVAEVRVEDAEPACGLGKGVDEVAVAGGVDADVLELGDYGKGLAEEGDEAGQEERQEGLSVHERKEWGRRNGQERWPVGLG